MKTFKRILLTTLCFIFIFSSCFFLSGCGNREEVLRLYVPGEYIPDEVLYGNEEMEGFENWYKRVTGKSIKVQKKEFDSNETMYTMVAVKRQDFDVICPSDYMVERLKNEGLLKKINSSVAEEYKNAVLGEEVDGEYPNQNLLDIISYDPNLEYSAPYMWGTMGIMYYFDGNQENSEEVNRADSLKSTWKSLFDVSERKIYMKDSERDSYTVALFDYYYDQLKTASNNFTDYTTPEYKALIKTIFTLDNNFSEKLENAGNTLKAQKKYVYDYETDEGKDDLLTSKGAQGYYGMFWSCDAGYIIADYSGEEVVYNDNFRFIVPTEGSNVWLDSFCIPKYAGNTSAANLFLQYMSDPDVAFSCMDYAGCTSAIYQTTLDYFDYLYPSVIADGTYTTEQFLNLSEEELASLELTEDDFDGIFLAKSDAFKAMYLSLMFPHLDITVGDFSYESPLTRCGVMRDLGSKASDELLIMWSILRRY